MFAANALAIFVLITGAAYATVFENGEASCAACSKTFETQQVVGTNTFGGIDADGCRTANGAAPLSVLVPRYGTRFVSSARR